MAISALNPATYGEGVVMICIFISSSLYGLTSFQGITYFRTFPKDPWHTKLMVTAVMLLSAFHISLCWHFMYHYFVVEFGSYGELFVPVWTTLATIPVTCAAECIYHLYFLSRIWKLSGKNKILCGAILLIELAHVAVLMEFTARCFHAQYWTDLTGSPRTKALATVALVLSVSGDLMITSSLCYYLHHCRTGYKKTDTLISTLIVYTINNGITTAIGDAIVVSMFLGKPNNLAFFGVFEITIELYANAILTSLNTRTRLRSQLAEFTEAPEVFNISREKTASRRLDLGSTASSDSMDQSNSVFSKHTEATERPIIPANAIVKTRVYIFVSFLNLDASCSSYCL
ncbi:hypothetical protein SISSUDRAFT_630061 [Sistotremastrum suecicum HHB10207 ss-3]|uniref:DUF6534 domain-containing protein n=1 Tax=Sistotremastrum suecicum HHB10207 ss-3 TaxID=1314776 RepID=A0A166EGX4_9AGAM|nr:hypothetical protein SISSUDRAFT_630061 [Sistotremastrum suecicum HHB10207 ss-3]